VTDIAQRREWLALLEAEFARRTARTEREANEGERQREAFVAELQQIAERFAAIAHRWPLQIDDMSIVEMMACRYFLPEHLMPVGLGTEEQIWEAYAARKAR
jgi:hypothetical protein